MTKQFWIYILARRKRGTIYVGLTSDLLRRVWEHRTQAAPGYTARYGIDRLVWFEQHPDFASAVEREKRLKRWRRAWKYDLIETDNPDWRDLYDDSL